MQVAFYSFAVLLALAVGHCESAGGNSRVLGGTAAVSGQFPEVVHIETPLQGSCVGVILNANHILTSSQCVVTGGNSTNPFFVRIIAGDLNLFQPTYRRFRTVATHIYRHPQLNAVTLLNDLAVVRVEPAFPLPHNTIDLSVLNQRVRRIGTGCQFAGWGNSNAAGALNAAQQVINMPILDRDQCNVQTVHANRVLESMICAGSIAASAQAICDGNLGGGLFCDNELVGILAFGTGCGVANQPSVFTQVRFHENWIWEQTRRTDATFP